MPDLASHQITGCRVAEQALACALMLRMRAAAPELIDRLSDLLGTAVPIEPNRAAGTDPRLFGLAPGEWLIVGGGAWGGPLRAALSGHTAHLAEMQAAYVRFRVWGSQVRDMLAKGTSLDLHPRIFVEGQCARTLFAQTHVLIDRLQGDAGFDIYADISLAQHLRHWFDDAAREFGRGGE